MSGVVADSATRSLASIEDIDLQTSAGLEQLLSVVRNAPLSRGEYNELRDAIFTFKQNGSEPLHKQQLIDVLVSSGLFSGSAPVAASTPPPEPPAVSAPAPTPEVTVEQKPVTPAAPAVAAPTHRNTMRSGGSRPQPTFAVTAVPVSTPTPPPVVETPPAPSVATPVVEPTPVPAPTPAPVAESVPESASAISSNPSDRIQAIKRDVNALVGNPVNLIDGDNQIGREYMNSLLDAMKKVNGGKPAEVSAAMERLEKAYGDVKAMLEHTDITQKPTASIQEPTSEPAAEAMTPVSPTPTEPSAPVIPEVGLPKSRLFSAPDPVEEPEEAPTVKLTPVSAEPTAQAEPTHFAPQEPDPTPVTPERTVEPPAATPAFTSVAENKAEQTANYDAMMAKAETEEAKREAEIAAMDPVMTPAVTDGLDQLLSEWKLFKSSGIFGTGPSGREHPLYRKLASLQMSAVIAGRFDDATPEVRQSITDYMNGWRYEEGILHQHGETFEHYLRRVIKKILDRKNGIVEAA